MLPMGVRVATDQSNGLFRQLDDPLAEGLSPRGRGRKPHESLRVDRRSRHRLRLDDPYPPPRLQRSEVPGRRAHLPARIAALHGSQQRNGLRVAHGELTGAAAPVDELPLDVFGGKTRERRRLHMSGTVWKMAERARQEGRSLPLLQRAAGDDGRHRRVLIRIPVRRVEGILKLTACIRPAAAGRPPVFGKLGFHEPDRVSSRHKERPLRALRRMTGGDDGHMLEPQHAPAGPGAACGCRLHWD